MRHINSFKYHVFSFFALALANLEVGGGGSPATAVSAKRTVNPGLIDVTKMTPEQMQAELNRLYAKEQSTVDSFKLRFNDGSESTLEFSDEAKTIPVYHTEGKLKGQQKGSARDGGGISIYGFGRNPITLYPNQAIDLAGRIPALLEFIAERADLIDAYVAKKSGSHKNDINRAELTAQLAAHGITWPAVVEDNSVEAEANEGTE